MHAHERMLVHKMRPLHIAWLGALLLLLFSPSIASAEQSSSCGRAERATAPDGSTVIAVATFGSSSDRHLRIARTSADGTLDPSFGSANGTDRLDALLPPVDEAHVAVQTDGNVVVALTVTGMGGHGEGVVLRLKPDGTLDTSFGERGFAHYAPPSGAHQIAIEKSTGDILVAGDAHGASVIARYRSSGALDASFGDGGIVRLAGSPRAIGFHVDLDGRIVYAANDGGVTLRRLEANGLVDERLTGDEDDASRALEGVLEATSSSQTTVVEDEAGHLVGVGPLS
jgi:uncharacterized delta-60 repeat protein